MRWRLFGLLGAFACAGVIGWWWSLGLGSVDDPNVSQHGPLRILAVGDSLALGYGSPNPPVQGFLRLLADRTARIRPGTTLENEAIPGSVIASIASHELQSVHRAPDVVIAVSGANDVQHGAPPLVVASATARMLDTLHRRFPRARVVLTDIPDESLVPAAPDFLRGPIHALVAADNAGVRRAARAHGGIVLPLYAISRSPLARDPANYGDGLHPSKLGHARLAARLWPAFKAALAI